MTGVQTGTVKIMKLDPDAIIPKYETEGSAGFDLSSIIECIIKPGEQALIPTGLAVEIPPGTELSLRPRSGLALKFMISVTNTPGTLDSDYRGPIGIILINHSRFKYYLVKKGDRIAQAVLSPIIVADIIEVDELSETDRGEGGYGSTGK